jgi:hypothetical protein
MSVFASFNRTFKALANGRSSLGLRPWSTSVFAALTRGRRAGAGAMVAATRDVRANRSMPARAPERFVTRRG